MPDCIQTVVCIRTLVLRQGSLFVCTRAHTVYNLHCVLLFAHTQVLKNPSVPFQEGRSIVIAMLNARGVAPYGPSVDVWAAGAAGGYVLYGGNVCQCTAVVVQEFEVSRHISMANLCTQLQVSLPMSL